ncbi:probable glutathione S-transferase parC [Amborella trichopoda]|uniref:probable glutathione S-transferase parC n=1 Tax=Amborella trichopoda TaxID=13333 RepID=UPI0005D3BF32|nr:probable glutathione S-transferase parC [Amborella trichopoda]|eukprot:XP_011629184.1 probable glutathione S-transferase parC [Amborella trichopoda]
MGPIGAWVHAPGSANYIGVFIFGKREKSKGEAQASAVKEFIENLKILEGALGDKPFFGGEKLGLVDVAVVPFVCWLHVYEVYGGFSVAAERPKNDAWAKRCMEKESVSKALQNPEKALEFVGILKKKYGVE